MALETLTIIGCVSPEFSGSVTIYGLCANGPLAAVEINVDGVWYAGEVQYSDTSPELANFTVVGGNIGFEGGVATIYIRDANNQSIVSNTVIIGDRVRVQSGNA